MSLYYWVFIESVQVASVIEEAWAPQYTYIGIIIDTNAIQKLQVCLCILLVYPICMMFSAA
jgi:hypothetical protein